MSRRSLLAPILLALTLPASLLAQSEASLIGKWNIEFEVGRKNENGEVTPVMGKGVLTISQKGDSLQATMEGGTRQDGTPTPPASFAGKVTAAGAVFIQKREGQVNMNGEVKPISITMTWILQATGDVLSGTMKRELPADMAAMASAEPSPVKGTRIKG